MASHLTSEIHHTHNFLKTFFANQMKIDLNKTLHSKLLQERTAYAHTRKRALAGLGKGIDLGWVRLPNREEIHDRSTRFAH
jgi:hypothetical protein